MNMRAADTILLAGWQKNGEKEKQILVETLEKCLNLENKLEAFRCCSTLDARIMEMTTMAAVLLPTTVADRQ